MILVSTTTSRELDYRTDKGSSVVVSLCLYLHGPACFCLPFVVYGIVFALEYERLAVVGFVVRWNDFLVIVMVVVRRKSNGIAVVVYEQRKKMRKPSHHTGWLCQEVLLLLDCRTKSNLKNSHTRSLGSPPSASLWPVGWRAWINWSKAC